MKTSNKIIILSSAIFLLAAGCNQKQAQQPVAIPQNQQAETASSTNYVVTPTPVGQTQTKHSRIIQDYYPNNGESSQLSVIQSVYGTGKTDSAHEETKYKVDAGVTAVELLKADHQVELKTYSFGDMITSISGVKADSKHFWEFFVNGKSSNVGAGTYKLQNGDKVEWKLSEIK